MSEIKNLIEMTRRRLLAEEETLIVKFFEKNPDADPLKLRVIYQSGFSNDGSYQHTIRLDYSHTDD